MPLSILYGTTATATCNQSVENAPFFCSQGRNYTSDRLPVCKWISLYIVAAGFSCDSNIIKKRKSTTGDSAKVLSVLPLYTTTKCGNHMAETLEFFSIKFTRLFLSAHT